MNKKIKKALFVIDVQPDFITTGPLANPRAAKKVPNIVAKIKAHDGLCFATHDTHFTKEQVKTAWPPEQGVAYEDSLEGQKLPYPHCIKLTPGWEIEPTVLEALREKNKDGQKKFFAVDKYTFGYKEWESYLKFFEFDEIEICGFVSSICVLANAIISALLGSTGPILLIKLTTALACSISLSTCSVPPKLYTRTGNPADT